MGFHRVYGTGVHGRYLDRRYRLEFMSQIEIESRGMDKNNQGECTELEEKWISNSAVGNDSI